MLCEYGCNKKGIYTLSNGKKCCSKNYQSCENIKYKNSEGVKKAHLDNKMYKFTKEDVSNSNKKSKDIALEKAFIENSCYSNEYIKKRFLEKVKYCCTICGISEWNNNKIVLELDHIDGNNSNNRINNLRLLCPNCHSQTPTFRGRNINTGFCKVSDDDLKKAIIKSKNIRQALIKVGLTPKGANYKRANKLKSEISNENIIN